MKFNINHEVRVKLTPAGDEVLAKSETGQYFPKEEDGWTEFQLWVLMEIFGSHIYNGCRVPFETEIEIVE